jgi:hypothetical protein
MSDRLGGSLLPILTLLALLAAGALAHAADDDRLGQYPYPAFGASTDRQSPSAAPRIYVPVHPAQPQEVGEEFAPIQATAFGGARSGQAQTGAPSGTAAGKPPAPADFSVRVGKNSGTVAPSVDVPNGG